MDWGAAQQSRSDIIAEVAHLRQTLRAAREATAVASPHQQSCSPFAQPVRPAPLQPTATAGNRSSPTLPRKRWDGHRAGSPGLNGQDLPFYVLPLRSRSPSPCGMDAHADGAGSCGAVAGLGQHAAGGHTTATLHAQQGPELSGIDAARQAAQRSVDLSQLWAGATRSAHAPDSGRAGLTLHERTNISAPSHLCSPPPSGACVDPHSHVRAHAHCTPASPQQHLWAQACPAGSSPRRPLSARLLYDMGSAQRMDAMDMLAQTARQAGHGEEQAQECAARGAQRSASPADGTRAERYDAHVGDLLRTRRERSRVDMSQEAPRMPQRENAPGSRVGPAVAGVDAMERSSAKLQRQAAAFQALEAYERQLAAELTVLQRSLRL
jgi:hypothetical protein